MSYGAYPISSTAYGGRVKLRTRWSGWLKETYLGVAGKYAEKTGKYSPMTNPYSEKDAYTPKSRPYKSN